MAFRATLSIGTNQATAATSAGIWSVGNAGLEPVALLGDEAPGCAMGVTLSAFTELALDDKVGTADSGGVIFLATLSGTGVSSANNTAIFESDQLGFHATGRAHRVM